MSVTIEPDILSNLHNSGESAISTGDSVAYFKIRGGLEFTAPLRWTASLVHDSGSWKIAAMHFSSNIFDNPVEAASEISLAQTVRSRPDWSCCRRCHRAHQETRMSAAGRAWPFPLRPRLRPAMS